MRAQGLGLRVKGLGFRVREWPAKGIWSFIEKDDEELRAYPGRASFIKESKIRGCKP